MGVLLAGLCSGGFFVLAPGLAQEEGGGGGGCYEYGPVSCGWALNWGPYLTNLPGVNPSSYACAESGKSLPRPSVTPPAYADGQLEKVTSYSCSGSVIDYKYISFNVSAVQWDPPISDSPTAGTFSSTAYVNVTSSDTSFCLEPVWKLTF